MPDTQLMSLLGVGFLLGLRHALNTTILQRSRRCLRGDHRYWLPAPSDSVGALDTPVTLLLVGSIVLICGIRIPDEFEFIAESGVGVLLIVLGGMLAFKLYRERWHLHSHRHDGESHVHLHSHQRQNDHRHRHWMFESIRPFCIGMAHGLAGSAALMLMILSTTEEMGTGLGSILVLGLGSIIGMMVIGLTISVPVIYSRSISQRIFGTVQGLAGIASLSVGIWMLVKLALSAAGG